MSAAGAATRRIDWREGAAMAVGKASFAAGMIDGALIVAGGTFWRDGTKIWSEGVEIYDPRTDAWTAGPALPHPLAYGAFTSLADGLSVYGGHDGAAPTLDVWTLPDAAAVWRRTGALPSARLHGRCEVVAGRVLLVGGARSVADFRTAHDDVLGRDAGAAGPWRVDTRLPGGARLLMATAVAGRALYVFGGLRSTPSGALENLADAHRYDPAARRWTRLADLPQGARGLSATAVGDRHIYLFGGNTAVTEEENRRAPDHGYLRRVLVYDVESDRYAEATPLPRPAMLLDFFWSGGVFYGAGGETMTDTLGFGRSHRVYIGQPASL